MALATEITSPATVSRLRWVLGQVLLVASGVFVYFRIRGITDASVEVAHAHASEIVRAERWLGLDVEATVQAPVVSSQTLATAANWVYVWGHWPVIVATMAWLVWRHRDAFRRLRDAMLVSGFLGMIVFVSYPVAPPRLFDRGLVDTVTESSEAYRYLQPPAFVNQYAAMPSLHAGWDLLVGLAILGAATTIGVKTIGALMPVLMTWAVVATANHYILDVVAGIALALIGHAVALWLESRRTSRRAGSPEAT
jgi:membrane-associated phospholipid phosphatase